MKIIIGLGNPGEKYENTWHNIGFMVLDEYIKENNFPNFSFNKKFLSELSEKNIGGEKIIIARPQTYMNESGRAVKLITDFYKARTSDLIIIHDDVDLLVSKIRISFNRGSAGHKGVQSIFQETGKEDFIRIRIGVSPQRGKKKAINTVLKKIGDNEKTKVKKSIKNAIEATEDVIKEGIEKAMTKHNQ